MGTNEKKRSSNVKQAAILALILAAALMGFMQYSRYGTEIPRVTVSFTNPDGRASAALRLEVAASEQERRKGLMLRKPGELAADQGMLFVFPREQNQQFWMKDTYIPLDMIFLDRNLKVVGILHDVPILNEEKRGIDARSQYVVELLAGTAKKLGITNGSVAALPASALALQ